MPNPAESNPESPSPHGEHPEVATPSASELEELLRQDVSPDVAPHDNLPESDESQPGRVAAARNRLLAIVGLGQPKNEIGSDSEAQFTHDVLMGHEGEQSREREQREGLMDRARQARAQIAQRVAGAVLEQIEPGPGRVAAEALLGRTAEGERVSGSERIARIGAAFAASTVGEIPQDFSLVGRSTEAVSGLSRRLHELAGADKRIAAAGRIVDGVHRVMQGSPKTVAHVEGMATGWLQEAAQRSRENVNKYGLAA